MPEPVESSSAVAVMPAHVGYIVDGNRRWARSHGLPIYEGHLAGYNALRDVVVATVRAGVPYVSVYAFSTENWKRGEGEVGKLMQLAHRLVRSELKDLVKEGIRVRFLGVPDGLSPQLLGDMRLTETETAEADRGTVLVCFNYGGQREIADAAAWCVRDGLAPEAITEAAIAERLYAPDVPPVDVVVRTSGEQRLSNFMLWRTAYSEFIFLEKYWPDMRPADVAGIIETYQVRGRRFGG